MALAFTLLRSECFEPETSDAEKSQRSSGRAKGTCGERIAAKGAGSGVRGRAQKLHLRAHMMAAPAAHAADPEGQKAPAEPIQWDIFRDTYEGGGIPGDPDLIATMVV